MKKDKVMLEAYNKVITEAKSYISVIIPTEVKLHKLGDEIASSIFKQIDADGASVFDFATVGSKYAFTTEDFSYSDKIPGFTLYAYQELVDKKLLEDAADEIKDAITNEFFREDKLYKPLKFK